MRPTSILFAVACLLPMWTVGSAASGNSYYWSNGERISLSPDPTSLVVILKDHSASASNLLAPRSTPGVAKVTASLDGRMAIIESPAGSGSSRDQILGAVGIRAADVAWSSNGYRFEDGVPIRPTNHICFKLKAGR